MTSFAFADEIVVLNNNSENVSENNSENLILPAGNISAKNMTYGRCVAGFTKAKNECYKIALQTSKDCGEENKNISSECKAKGKKDGVLHK
jgi:hypothetical protein